MSLLILKHMARKRKRKQDELAHHEPVSYKDMLTPQKELEEKVAGLEQEKADLERRLNQTPTQKVASWRGNMAEWYHGKAIAARNVDKQGTSLRYLRIAAMFDPNNAKIFADLAGQYLIRDNPKKAVQCSTQALRLNPDSETREQAEHNIGVAFEILGNEQRSSHYKRLEDHKDLRLYRLKPTH